MRPCCEPPRAPACIHLTLMPVTIVMGAVVALMCNVISVLPEHSVLPLNAVTPLFGAPVIIYIILKRN